MPRPEDGLLYEDTYPYLLANNGFEVVNRARRANDTSRQCEPLNLVDDIDAFDADVVVLHLGIVDCAPRVLRRVEGRLLGLLPGLIRKPVVSFAAKNRYQITRWRKITYVTVDQFQSNVMKLILHVGQETTLVIIGILQASGTLSRRSFNINQNISRYNELLEHLAKKNGCAWIDPNCFLFEEKMLPDGIHISPEMHSALVKAIMESAELVKQ